MDLSKFIKKAGRPDKIGEAKHKGSIADQVKRLAKSKAAKKKEKKKPGY